MTPAFHPGAGAATQPTRPTSPVPGGSCTATQQPAWRTAGDDELVMQITFTPPGRMEAMFENLFGLAADGKTNRKGLPAPFLQLAAIAHEFLDDIHLAQPPLAVQRALFGLADPIALRRGYRGIDERYRGVAAV